MIIQSDLKKSIFHTHHVHPPLAQRQKKLFEID